LCTHTLQDTGNKLRVKGEGDAAKGAPTGDLYVFISAKSHPTFTRKGADIYADKSVQYLDAILGNDSVRVEVVDGEVEIKVPAGTQPGTIHAILLFYIVVHTRSVYMYAYMHIAYTVKSISMTQSIQKLLCRCVKTVCHVETLSMLVL
jgi:DnaJ C terminal domain